MAQLLVVYGCLTGIVLWNEYHLPQPQQEIQDERMTPDDAGYTQVNAWDYYCGGGFGGNYRKSRMIRRGTAMSTLGIAERGDSGMAVSRNTNLPSCVR
jgi:hypothetical protein